jgi:L-iditol 2-dehydrogenase
MKVDRPGPTETNKSFVLSAAREFSYEERPAPELRTSRDVRVRVIATGLCGSDVSDANPVPLCDFIH